MFCGNCGTRLEDDALVCPVCGRPIEGRTPVNAAAEEPKAAAEATAGSSGIELEMPIRDPFEEMEQKKGTENPFTDPAPTLKAEEPWKQEQRTETQLNGQPIRKEQADRGAYSYGNAQKQPEAAKNNTAKSTGGRNGFAIAALVMACISVISCCIPFISIITSLLGVIFGIVGLKSEERTMALISLIICAVYLLLSILIGAGSVMLARSDIDFSRYLPDLDI